MQVMRPLTLDHVAFWVTDREPIVERCERWLGMHVIDRQPTFTLVGTSARHGKLTLFDAEGRRESGVFRRIGLRVADLGAARDRLPVGTPETFDLGEGINVTFVAGPDGVDYDLDHVALVSPDPVAAAAGYERLGFARSAATRVEVGGAYVEFDRDEAGATTRPLLNHLAVRVESAEQHERAARACGIEVESTVEAPNTRAVFVWAPDRVRVEYVEHKPTFSLA